MRGMILAAGLGTRLRAMTATRPKALVEIGNRTLLQIALERFRDFGILEVIINVHHFADMVVDYLKAHDSFGMHVEISREGLLLDTGGGLKQAGWFFEREREPFLLHNVDVISAIDFRKMLAFHGDSGALATLAVQNRPTSRYLIFDDQLQLCGRRLVREQKVEMVRPVQRTEEAAFTGVHVISPELIPLMTESGTFSIIACYLRLAEAGEKIVAFRADAYSWRDLGTPESVALANAEIG